VKLRISVEGRTYDVEVVILEERSEPLREPEPEPRVAIPEAVLKPRPVIVLPQDRILRSPIAGLITSVIAETGQVVQKDEPLVTIEAMKMESRLGAPVDGVVKNIQVSPGESVKAGQVLVELA
jgi:biotin carboxyl carrier protein